jgi:hypothetical protein
MNQERIKSVILAEGRNFNFKVTRLKFDLDSGNEASTD